MGYPATGLTGCVPSALRAAMSTDADDLALAGGASGHAERRSAHPRRDDGRAARPGRHRRKLRYVFHGSAPRACRFLGVVWGVGRLGFEPRTLGLKVRCSDQTELPARRGMPVSRARLRLAGRLPGHGASFYYTTELFERVAALRGIRSIRGEEGGFQTRPYGVRGGRTRGSAPTSDRAGGGWRADRWDDPVY